MIEIYEVELRLNTRADVTTLKTMAFDEVIIATGVAPRQLTLEGIDSPKVVSYVDAILGRKSIGERVAVMGAGGIGFDVAELISHAGVSGSVDVKVFAREWGIAFRNHPRGGVTGVQPQVAAAARTVYLMQRKSDRVGKGLGRTTGWTHRLTLKRRGVHMINGVEYLKIDEAGLHTRINGALKIFDVDTVIVCAGQLSLRGLYDELQNQGIRATLVGGAFEAGELDAKRAIDQASRLAVAI